MPNKTKQNKNSNIDVANGIAMCSQQCMPSNSPVSNVVKLPAYMYIKPGCSKSMTSVLKYTVKQKQQYRVNKTEIDNSPPSIFWTLHILHAHVKCLVRNMLIEFFSTSCNHAHTKTLKLKIHSLDIHPCQRSLKKNMFGRMGFEPTTPACLPCEDLTSR